MTYRIFVFDLDGTLTNSKKEITPRTLEALRRAQEAGVVLVLASGRPTPGVAYVADAIGLHRSGGFVLPFNGGAIIDWRTKETLFAQTLDDALLPRLYAAARRADLPILTYSEKEIITESAIDRYIALEAEINRLPVRRVADFLQMAESMRGRLPKCLIVGDEERLAPLEVEMRDALGSEMGVYRSAPFFLELVPPGVDKALTLERLLAHLGLRREDCVAFGDGYNDLSMLRFAGLGVAMGNAEDVVRKAADYVARSNDEDGVALVIEHLLSQQS